MQDSMPAWMLRETDENQNILALKRIIQFAPRPNRILEYFGGMGGMTRVLRSHWMTVPVQTWDHDELCVKHLRSFQYPATDVQEGDSLTLACPQKGDGVSMDFNRLTLLRAQKEYLKPLSRVFNAWPTWVHITDSARSKLHLNYKTYGLENPTMEAYLSRFDEWVNARWPYRIHAFAGHHKATLLLFVRDFR